MQDHKGCSDLEQAHTADGVSGSYNRERHRMSGDSPKEHLKECNGDSKGYCDGARQTHVAQAQKRFRGVPTATPSFAFHEICPSMERHSRSEHPLADCVSPLLEWSQRSPINEFLRPCVLSPI